MKLKKINRIISAVSSAVLAFSSVVLPATCNSNPKFVKLNTYAFKDENGDEYEVGYYQDNIIYRKYADHINIFMVQTDTLISGDVVIPEEIDGVPVTEIQKNAFKEQANITSVSIPSTVEKIGEEAFNTVSNDRESYIPGESFSALTEITVAPDNQYYTSLDGCLYTKDLSELIQYPAGRDGSYTAPENLSSIHSHAFDWSLVSSADFSTAVNLGEIPDYGLYRTVYLKDIKLPSSITRIGVSAFQNSGITAIAIPENTVSVGAYAFSYCISLQDIAFYNPDCAVTTPQYTIENTLNVFSFTGTIYGYEGSKAQEICDNYSYKFDSIENYPYYSPESSGETNTTTTTEETTTTTTEETTTTTTEETTTTTTEETTTTTTEETTTTTTEETTTTTETTTTPTTTTTTTTTEETTTTTTEETTTTTTEETTTTTTEETTTTTETTTTPTTTTEETTTTTTEETTTTTETTTTPTTTTTTTTTETKIRYYISFTDVTTGETVEGVGYTISSTDYRDPSYNEILYSEKTPFTVDFYGNLNFEIVSLPKGYYVDYSNLTFSGNSPAPVLYVHRYDTGDVDGNNLIDASDASSVLLEYAMLSTGQNSSFEGIQSELADIDKNGLIDASDASYILAYYAYLSTGGDGTVGIREYLNVQ